MKKLSMLALRAFSAAYLDLARPAFLLLTAAFILFGLRGGIVLNAQMRQAAENVAMSVQNEMRLAENQSLLIASLPTVNNAFSQRSPSLDSWIALDEDIEIFMTNNAVNSVEVYFPISGKIIVSSCGLTDAEDYDNPAFLKRIVVERPQGVWYAREYGKTIFSTVSPVLSFVRTLPLYENRVRGYLSVNLNLSALTGIAQIQYDASLGDCAVYTDDCWIFRTGNDLAAGFAASRESEDDWLNGRLYVSALYDEGSTVRAAYRMTLPTFLWKACCPVYWLVGGFLLALILLPLAALIDRKTHAPVRALVERFASEYPDAAESDDMIGEEELLYQAFDSLSEQLRHAQRTMRENQPLLREQMVMQLLFTPVSIASLEKELCAAGMSLPYPYYAVAILEYPDNDIPRDVRMAMSMNAEQLFAHVGHVYAAQGEGGSALFLLNSADYQHLQERVEMLCRTLQDSAEGTFGFKPSFSVSVCSETDPSLYNAYLQAREGLPLARKKLNEDQMAASSQSPYTPTVDANTVYAVGDAILAQDALRLRAILDQTAHVYFNAALPAEVARRLTGTFCCALYCRLSDLGMEMDPAQLASYLKRIAREEKSETCMELIRLWAAALAGGRPGLVNDAAMYVESALRYIGQNYCKRIGVTQIAQAVALSPVYLNRIFKEATGSTLSEYLNICRLEHSLKLLADGESIVSIAERMGFGESRAYIRNFKNHYGTTPGEYRKTGIGMKNEGGTSNA